MEPCLLGGSTVPSDHTCPTQDSIKLEIGGRIFSRNLFAAPGAGLFVVGEVPADGVGTMPPKDHSTSNSQAGHTSYRATPSLMSTTS
jgi:hypothetical protein